MVANEQTLKAPSVDLRSYEMGSGLKGWNESGFQDCISCIMLTTTSCGTPLLIPCDSSTRWVAEEEVAVWYIKTCHACQVSLPRAIMCLALALRCRNSSCTLNISSQLCQDYSLFSPFASALAEALQQAQTDFHHMGKINEDLFKIISIVQTLFNGIGGDVHVSSMSDPLATTLSRTLLRCHECIKSSARQRVGVWISRTLHE